PSSSAAFTPGEPVTSAARAVKTASDELIFMVNFELPCPLNSMAYSGPWQGQRKLQKAGVIGISLAACVALLMFRRVRLVAIAAENQRRGRVACHCSHLVS